MPPYKYYQASKQIEKSLESMPPSHFIVDERHLSEAMIESGKVPRYILHRVGYEKCKTYSDARVAVLDYPNITIVYNNDEEETVGKIISDVGKGVIIQEGEEADGIDYIDFWFLYVNDKRNELIEKHVKASSKLGDIRESEAFAAATYAPGKPAASDYMAEKDLEEGVPGKKGGRRRGKTRRSRKH